MSRSFRFLVASAAVVGAGLGGFALTAATDDSAESTQEAPSMTVVDDLAPLVPLADGPEPPVFAGSVSSAVAGSTGPVYSDERVTAYLSTSPQSDVCFKIQVADEVHTGCVRPDDIRTGTTYIATTSHGGPVDVIGIVPDDAATVRIDGHELSVTGNVWHYVGQAGADLGFEVVSSDGRLTARRP